MKEFIALILLLAGFLYLGTRKTEAEYNHCLITSTDKTICESVNPHTK